MIEVLRDPIWQFVGALLALLGLGAAFWVYWLQTQTKELAFGLLSSRRPLSISDELSSRVTVLLDGKQIGNLHLLIYALKNSGNRAIAQDDWERPFSLSFGADTIVSAEIATQTPMNLGAMIEVKQSQISIVPLLFNPGDQLIIKILVSSRKPAPVTDLRVLDVPSLSPLNLKPKRPRFFDSGLPTLMYAVLLYAAGVFALSEDKREAYAFLAFAIFVPIFGWATRIIENTGSSARRRINEP